ncbi:MAG: hypothetical protein QXE92_02635 [Thermofilaceae archaeon]
MPVRVGRITGGNVTVDGSVQVANTPLPVEVSNVPSVNVGNTPLPVNITNTEITVTPSYVPIQVSLYSNNYWVWGEIFTNPSANTVLVQISGLRSVLGVYVSSTYNETVVLQNDEGRSVMFYVPSTTLCIYGNIIQRSTNTRLVTSSGGTGRIQGGLLVRTL